MILQSAMLSTIVLTRISYKTDQGPLALLSKLTSYIIMYIISIVPATIAIVCFFTCLSILVAVYHYSSDNSYSNAVAMA